jgi:hypothetical protein
MMRNITVDSLSPLFFCIALVTLTHELNNADCGYQGHKIEREISHLFYMDGLKLIVRDEDELENNKNCEGNWQRH